MQAGRLSHARSKQRRWDQVGMLHETEPNVYEQCQTQPNRLYSLRPYHTGRSSKSRYIFLFLLFLFSFFVARRRQYYVQVNFFQPTGLPGERSRTQSESYNFEIGEAVYGIA